MSRTGDGTDRNALAATLIPRAIEVMTAWGMAEDGDPAQFTAVMDRAMSDVVEAEHPRRELARFLFAQAALSGALLDDLAARTGCTREEVLQSVHRRYAGDG